MITTLVGNVDSTWMPDVEFMRMNDQTVLGFIQAAYEDGLRRREDGI
jgi:hypothetical protein